METPDFSTLARLEEAALGAKLEAVRATISHRGEKGRALAQAVILLLREFLPAEYGLSTGFIAHHADGTVKLSPQLDIIIYDAVRSGPLARLTACDVFPLEAVHGYVEVKASLRSSSDSAEAPSDDSIEHCLEQNRELRRMVDRRYHAQVPGTVVGSVRQQRTWVPIRGFVVAFAPAGTVASDADAFAQRMADVSRRLGPPTHLHGVFVARHGYFRTRPVNPTTAQPEDMRHVHYVQEHGLAVFKTDLLHGLARFPRYPSDWSPAVDEYFAEPAWNSRAPANVLVAAQQQAGADRLDTGRSA
ncbi:MAG: hypothetical protein HYV93_21190 [Candidatus Rokubacteria bacterium]|nr:hypothetical protein [Candidatus Rokubacteria bacterium]